MPVDAATAPPLASVVVDVMSDGTLHVHAYVGGVSDSGGYFWPSEAGEYITKALQEVRRAVLSPELAP